MAEFDTTQVNNWKDSTLTDASGSKVGTVSDVYLDDETGQPDWLAVSTGLFGSKVSFVPVHGARIVDGKVTVPYDKDIIKDAPRIDADGSLSIAEEEELYRYYGLTYAPHAGRDQMPTPSAGTSPPPPAPMTSAPTSAAPATSAPVPPAPVTSGQPTSMVRSEEELSVGTHSQEAGRVKLRKWVETENVSVSVPVERQMARVVRESVDGNDMSGVDSFVEGEEEIVLSEEIVDVAKRVVAKERVGIETETVTEQVPVNETVRKERIEVVGDGVVTEGVADPANSRTHR